MDVRVFTLDPGNYTRYVVVLTPLPDDTCRLLGGEPGSFLVSVPNHPSYRTMLLSPGMVPSAAYVEEKLGCSWGDAAVLSNFLSAWEDPDFVAAFVGNV
jgi:hypothetical protein